MVGCSKETWWCFSGQVDSHGGIVPPKTGAAELHDSGGGGAIRSGVPRLVHSSLALHRRRQAHPPQVGVELRDQEELEGLNAMHSLN